MTFGQRFRKLRLRKGLKQQGLVNEFNKLYGYTFSKAAISLYENDKRKPEFDTLRDFALYFDVSIDYLLCISNNEDINKRIPVCNRVDFTEFIREFLDDECIDTFNKHELFEEITLIYFNSF